MNFRIQSLRARPRLSLGQLLAFARTRTGVLAITTVGNLIVRTGSSMLLTRLLTPYAFGIIGIISSVFFVVAMITDLGFQDFLIRHHRTDDRHFRDVIWTIHAKRGFLLFVAVAIASPAIAWAFGKPVVALPLAVASLIFLINGVASLSLITALRRDKSRELSLLDFGLQIFQTIACLLLALWWRNAWSIIGAMLLQSGLRAILSYSLFADSAQHPARDRTISREFLAFSRIVLVSSLLALLIGQSDKVVLGRLLTLDEFGLYSIALTIASAPAMFAQSYVSRIAFPVYSQVWRDAANELPTVYYKVRRLPSSAYAFGCGGLIGGAAFLIALLYDPRYAAASKFLSLLMIGTALCLPNMAASQLLIAIGEIKRSVHVTVVRFLWVASMIPIGFVLFGAIGVVAAMGTLEVPATLYCWMLLRRVGVLDLRDELSYLALVAAGAAIGFIAGTEILHLVPNL